MSHANHSLYVLQTYNYIMIVIIYVNDLIILVNNVDMIIELKSSLKREFEMSDLGKLYFFLRVHFERDRRTCTNTMDQQSYIEIILEQFGMGDCKPMGTLLNTKTSLAKNLEEKYEEHSQKIRDILYQEAVGSLMYAISNKCGKLVHVEIGSYAF